MKRRKFHLASRCPFCKQDEENLEHILWFCNFSEIIWKWLGGIFNFLNPKSLEDILNYAHLKSPVVKKIWRNAAFITMKEIWFLRNKVVYENASADQELVKRRIVKFTHDSDCRMKRTMWNSIYDLEVIKFFNLSCRKVKKFQVKEIFFSLPKENQILFCGDGASKGNPGQAGFGFIWRDWNGEVLVDASGGMDIATNFLAEVMTVLCVCEWAISKGLLNVCFRSDSKATIATFISGNLPWFAITRWNNICAKLQWEFIYSFREINFSADSLA
ncbi:uncharacterized protein LOC113295247 [Papaver somniferum]|uniref:uncharacterized protein LOC113295247 n=1 Tax=Papaver somniferum TaxID=3469 RepID=UPI000E7027B7|nr:uncharacterized protein LOC113295247 [Papaver somniferum]